MITILAFLYWLGLIDVCPVCQGRGVLPRLSGQTHAKALSNLMTCWSCNGARSHTHERKARA